MARSATQEGACAASMHKDTFHSTAGSACNVPTHWIYTGLLLSTVSGALFLPACTACLVWTWRSGERLCSYRMRMYGIYLLSGLMQLGAYAQMIADVDGGLTDLHAAWRLSAALAVGISGPVL